MAKLPSRFCAAGMLVAVLLTPGCTTTRPAVLMRTDRTVVLPAGFATVGGDTDAKSGLPRRIRQVELDYELVLVPAGPFTITTFDTLTGARLTRSDSTDAFYIGTATITNAQYHRYRPAHRSAPGDGNPRNADTAPVLDIHWQQAHDYCAWAGLALPGETQWLKAVYAPRPRATARRNAAAGPVRFVALPLMAYPEWCADSATFCSFPRNAADTEADSRKPVTSGGTEDGVGLLSNMAEVAGIMGESMLAGTPVGWAYLGFQVLQSFPEWQVATRAALSVQCELLPGP